MSPVHIFGGKLLHDSFVKKVAAMQLTVLLAAARKQSILHDFPGRTALISVLTFSCSSFYPQKALLLWRANSWQSWWCSFYLMRRNTSHFIQNYYFDLIFCMIKITATGPPFCIPLLTFLITVSYYFIIVPICKNILNF